MAAVHRPCQMRLSRPAGFKPPTTRIFSAPTSAHAVRWGARRLTRVSCTGPSCSTWRTQQSNTLPRVQSQRLGEAPVGLQGVAVLAVAGGVLGARQEQPIAVGGPGVEKVLQQAEPQLLVVGIVPELAGRGGQHLHQRGTIEARLQIGRSEGNCIGGPEREERRVQPLDAVALTATYLKAGFDRASLVERSAEHTAELQSP